MKFMDENGLLYFWQKVKNKLETKQDTLVSGTTIKTINGNSLLGAGDMTISQGGTQVNSDWNATSGVAQILNKPVIPTVPTNVSAFTNDAGYQKAADVSAAIAQAQIGEFQVMASKPATGAEGIVYLIGAGQPYRMWIWEGSAWIDLGDTTIDLTGYAKTSDLAAYLKTADLVAITNAEIDTILAA